MGFPDERLGHDVVRLDERVDCLPQVGEGAEDAVRAPSLELAGQARKGIPLLAVEPEVEAALESDVFVLDR